MPSPHHLFFFFFLLSPALAATSNPAAAPKPSSSGGAAADALALFALQSAVDHDGRLPFNRSSLSPYAHCRWDGVQCSMIDGELRVTHLVLEGLHFLGLFPAAILSRLDQLRLLSLKNNSLSGAVGDLSNLTNLKGLFLDHNRLSGGFPLSVLVLDRLRTIDLSHNALSGRLPAAVATAYSRLSSFRLEFNRFTGPLPPFNQSTLSVLNVSENGFSGPIPATTVLLSLDPSAFSGNPGLCGKAVKKECRPSDFFLFGSPAASPGPSAGHLTGILKPEIETSPYSSFSTSYKRHRRIAAAVGVAAGAVFLIGLLAFCAAARRRQRRPFLPKKMSSSSAATQEESNEIWAPPAAEMMPEEKVERMGSGAGLVFCAGEEAAYTLDQLMRASADMMGKGTVGSTYKASVTDEITVSVKRVDAGRLSPTGREIFEQHLAVVGQLRHPNLVPLRAYFQAKEERLLVYDYQPNGSLFSLIHGSKSARSKAFHWTSCLKIAEDVAQGLAYIHQSSRLVHGNLTSSNVLLGDDFEARLVDCCLALLVDSAADSGAAVAYRAPEALGFGGRLTVKADIYAFGVLMLELLAGRPPAAAPPSTVEQLAAWVRSAREDGAAENERVMMLVGVAAACVRASPDGRPTAWQVLKMLQEVKAADGDDETDAAATDASEGS